MSGIPSKTIGKNHKVFIRKPKQVRVKSHGNRWKTFLARRKRRELEEKIRWAEIYIKSLLIGLKFRVVETPIYRRSSFRWTRTLKYCRISLFCRWWRSFTTTPVNAHAAFFARAFPFPQLFKQWGKH